LKIFLDTASLSEIREAADLGVLDGVTTNPTLVSREEGAFRDILHAICTVVDGPVSGEVVATDYDGMLTEARELAGIHPNIVVKIPMLRDGLKAIHQLRQEGIRTNCTLVFSTCQAILAAKAGATFISPFVGRLDDVSHVGMDLIREISAVFENYDFEAELLTASVRSPLHVIEAGLAGADIVTMPWKVLQQMWKHPLTDVGLERFLADWKQVEARQAASR
jgi:transaldolase